ncbi:MAG: SH3 domain-containing protein, partial [Anaerolineae bacterium]|nr:SH3 domain-containing protein [Anaerolineae bacterium]
MKTFLKVLFISVLVLMLAVPALAQQAGQVVNASRVNLRSGPGVGFPVVTILGRGQQLTVISANVDSSWLQVRLLNGTTGWVNARYIAAYGDQGGGVPVTQPTGRVNGVVNTPLLNVRGGPGANFNVVGKLAQYTAVNLLGRNADSSWAQITIPNVITGW